jgi:biopolymer transport protein ExbD
MKKFGAQQKNSEKHLAIEVSCLIFLWKIVNHLKTILLILVYAFISNATAVGQTVIVNSKSSSSSVSSFETGSHDRSSNSSAVAIDSRGQSSFSSIDSSYVASSSDAFQAAKSNSSRNDVTFQTKGSSASTSNQEISRVYGK